MSPYPRLETPCWPLWLDTQKCVIRMLWVRVKNLIFFHKTRVSLNSFDAYSSCMCQDRSWKWGPAIFMWLLSWDVNRPHGAETLEEHGGTKRRKASVIILKSSYIRNLFTFFYSVSSTCLYINRFVYEDVWNQVTRPYTARRSHVQRWGGSKGPQTVQRWRADHRRFMTFQVRKGKTVMSCSCMYVTVNVCI